MNNIRELSERACVGGIHGTNNKIADFIMQAICQHQWQSVVWVNEAYQTIFGCIPAQPHFLDIALLAIVSISVIGCGCLTTIESWNVWQDAAVFSAVWFHIK